MLGRGLAVGRASAGVSYFVDKADKGLLTSLHDVFRRSKDGDLLFLSIDIFDLRAQATRLHSLLH